jgi:glycosyltransferase involved in cell wall biosynthesis
METATQLVSVVVPCLNAGPMLRPAMLSVIEQSYPNIEIIFVDNNSTDGSLEVAEQLAQSQARPILVTRCAAQGANNARNWGFGLARGEFIQWMDADDRLDPDKIALQVAALERNSADDIAYGDWTANRIEPGKPRTQQRQDLQQVQDQVLRTLAGIWYPPHLYLLRRRAAQLLQDVQGWWPARKVATDVEYSAIAALLGLRFRYVAGAHVHYNTWSASQISGATSYRDRVAGLEAIFRRLRQLAESGQAKVTLTRRHKALLNQNWDIWNMPRAAAVLTKLPGRRFRLRHARTGKEIELRPREAAIAKALLANSWALSSCHFALRLIDALPEVKDDPVTVVQTLERLQSEGFLERVTDAAQQIAGDAGGQPSIGSTLDVQKQKTAARRSIEL